MSYCSLLVQALINRLEEQVDILAGRLVLEGDDSALITLGLVLEPVERWYEDAVPFIQSCLQHILTHLSEQREHVFVDFEQVESFWKFLGCDIFKNILIQVLAEHGRDQSDFLLTLHNTVPRLTLEHNRFVLKLGPDAEIERLKWKELVQYWVDRVFLQRRGGLEYFKVEE